MSIQKIFGIKQVIPSHMQNKYVPSITIVELHEVLDEILQIDETEMSRVQLYGQDPHRIDITMKTDDEFWHYIAKHIDEQYQLRSGRVITIVKPFEEFKIVRVRRVPGAWDEGDLERIFSFYGSVKSVEEEKIRPNVNNQIRESWRHLNTGTKR